MTEMWVRWIGDRRRRDGTKEKKDEDPSQGTLKEGKEDEGKLQHKTCGTGRKEQAEEHTENNNEIGLK